MPEESNTVAPPSVVRKPFPIIKALIVVLIIIVGLDLISLGWHFFSPKTKTKTTSSSGNNSVTNGTAKTNNNSATNSLSVKKNTTSGWQTFTDTKHKLTFDFPGDWTQAATDDFVFVSKGSGLLLITYIDPGIGDVTVIKKETLTINKQPVEFSYFIPKGEAVKSYAIAKYGIKVPGQKNGYTALFSVNSQNASVETPVIKQILGAFKLL